jgi:hypothetical protein
VDHVVTDPAPHDADATVVSPRAIGLVALGVLGAGVLAAVVDPTDGPVVCPFRLATGLDCPLCGATRAVHSFATGHPLRAMDHNLLIAIAIPLLLVGLVAAAVAAQRGRSVRFPAMPRSVWVGLTVVVGAFWLLRNLPAFGWLGSS